MADSMEDNTALGKDLLAEFPASPPRHISVIMDGNNRWARLRGLRGGAGHRAGAEAARETVFACVDHQIEYLSLFAFSSENWLRPNREVKGLMALFLSVLRRHEIRQMHERNVRLQFIGDRSNFPSRLQYNMNEVERLTRHNTGTVVTVAADYGGQWDITHACRVIAERVKSGELDIKSIDTQTVQQHMCLGDAPPPDLCIRTGGEKRISNFLLWQFAYTELYFSDVYWPDFDRAHLQAALDEFSQRKRRFGGQSTSDETHMDADLTPRLQNDGVKIA